MSIKIKRIDISGLFDTKNVIWELSDLNILVGKNGLGKSTILQLIKAAVTDDFNCTELKLCTAIEINFNDESSISLSSNTLISPKKFKDNIIKKYINSGDFEISFNKMINEALSKSDIKELPEDLKKNLEREYLKNLTSEDGITKFLKNKKNNSMDFPVEYISTVNLSANSINNITTSDGKTTNFLDFEIKEELNRLFFSKNNKKNIKDLILVLNNMFKDSDKKVSIHNNNLKIHLKNGQSIGYESLSSGERQVIYIFIKVINANENNALILMDEPEISLHLSWQESLLSEIRKVNKNSQIIIVTHSPAIVMNGWMDSFIDIKDILVEKESD
ncbi:AAA family ATPase [Acinetobacter modestus]|uniref:AAA family ATPase n=1 Tax=Acinetobacter modestus TaxID=1776740 RepID=UPI001F4BAB52|nr:ATP-binding protein [Acinetobacter modestus]MCH7333832.1 ATP-binding protein [Acinetobacter modestus]